MNCYNLIKIVMSKDARFSKLSVLAPAALSASMDASVLAVPAAGAIVSTVLNQLSKAFMLKKWFYGVMSAKEAESLIMSNGRNGSFLVRESMSHPGEYVLSVRVQSRVNHVLIRRQNDKYDIGSGEQFDDLVGLIEHFRSYPMFGRSGDAMKLLQPVSSSTSRRIQQYAEDKVYVVQEIDESKEFNARRNLDLEFMSLQMLYQTPLYPTKEAMKPANNCKNRYRNVVPYDQTRVVLKKLNSKSNTDYINANFIRPALFDTTTSSMQSSNESLHSTRSLKLFSFSKRPSPFETKSLSDEAIKEVQNTIKMDHVNGNQSSNLVKDKIYIAAQGCLPNTKGDFWRMIWQEDVRVIAMTANEFEMGNRKCERYWPNLGKEESYDKIIVKSISEILNDDYIVRELSLKVGKYYRTVYQYHFTAWPDHDTPPEPKGVLSYINDINTCMYKISQEKDAPKQNILCVHCSAGIGRTGTFIVLDIIIDKIKMNGPNYEVDVYKTVKQVREHRNGMVQNKTQYNFIYFALQKYMEPNSLKLTKKILN